MVVVLCSSPSEHDARKRPQESEDLPPTKQSIWLFPWIGGSALWVSSEEETHYLGSIFGHLIFGNSQHYGPVFQYSYGIIYLHYNIESPSIDPK